MKSKLPGLTACGLLLFWCLPGAAQSPAAGADGTSAPLAAEPLLQSAIAALDRYSTISASIRQRASLLDHQLVGSGHYLQGPARFNLLRLELQLQAGSSRATLLVVGDGRFLWIHRDVLATQIIYRVDADRVRQAWEKEAADRGQPRAIDALALGGLPRMLRGLSESFQFTSVEDGQLGAFPVRIVRGAWRNERLVDILPDQRAALEQGQPADLTKLPEHVPDEVLLYLGREDLFPYRFEYRRSAFEKKSKQAERKEPVTLATLELFEVQVNGAIDTQQFIYNPGQQPFEDATDAVLKGQGVFSVKLKQ
jgi:hypothetical protein